VKPGHTFNCFIHKAFIKLVFKHPFSPTFLGPKDIPRSHQFVECSKISA